MKCKCGHNEGQHDSYGQDSYCHNEYCKCEKFEADSQETKNKSICKINMHIETITKSQYCCICSDWKKIYCQMGDGSMIHNYCLDCYRKHYHFCEGKKDLFSELCKECLSEEKNNE